MDTLVANGMLVREATTDDEMFRFIDQWLLSCLVRNIPSDDAFYILDKWWRPA